jgi:hypothetical protein
MGTGSAVRVPARSESASSADRSRRARQDASRASLTVIGRRVFLVRENTINRVMSKRCPSFRGFRGKDFARDFVRTVLVADREERIRDSPLILKNATKRQNHAKFGLDVSGMVVAWWMSRCARHDEGARVDGRRPELHHAMAGQARVDADQ